MSKKIFVFLGSLLLITSCATNIHRGVIAMKIDESNAHVGLSQNEASIGDHVELYANRCTRVKGETQNCQKISKGHGKVTSIISSDYVAVEFDKGISFQEGDFIEKHSH